jgi:hypothetical protein
MKTFFILPVLLLFCTGESALFSQDIIPASQYQLVVRKKNNPDKTRTLILDKPVEITTYERYDKTVLDYLEDLVVGYDPGYMEYKGHCTIVNESVIMVGRDSIPVDAIRTIKAWSDKTAGETTGGLIMLGSLPLWAYVAYFPFTWSGLEAVLGVLFISVPAATAGIACAGLGIYLVAARNVKRNYNTERKWDLEISGHSIPLQLSRE